LQLSILWGGGVDNLSPKHYYICYNNTLTKINEKPVGKPRTITELLYGIRAEAVRARKKFLMNGKPVRKPRNVMIDPEALYRARVEAVRARKTMGEWLEEAIEERIKREQEKAK